jgi:hypothetical protein
MELLDEFGIPIVEDFKTSAKRFKDQGADDTEIQTYISDFKQMKPKIKDNTQKDIDKWKTWDEFKAFVDDLKNVKTKGQEKKEKKMAGAKLVAEDKYWRVYQITTHEAAMMYGSGTKWCITQSDGKYWDQYNEDSDFYFYISKRLPPSSPFYKIALQVGESGEPSDFVYWDATDKQHGGSESHLYSNRGGIHFKLPPVPTDVLSAAKMKRMDEMPLHTIYLNPGYEITSEMLKELSKLDPDSDSGAIGKTSANDYINIHTDDKEVVRKAVEILGSEMVKEVAPEI